MLINSETIHTTAMYLQISNTIPEEKLSGTARVSEFAVQQKERVKFTRFSKQCTVASRSLQSSYMVAFITITIFICIFPGANGRYVEG